MEDTLNVIGFWGHAAAGFLYAALAVWIFQQFGSINRQQITLIAAMGLMAVWGITTIMAGPMSFAAQLAETVRNFGWLAFLYALLRSGGANEQPRTIVMTYIALALVLICQPFVDGAVMYAASHEEFAGAVPAAEQSAKLIRMLFAIGAVVLVHNLYTGTAPDARWGLSLPMAALAAMWTFDLNLYTIGYLAGAQPVELTTTRGAAFALLVPVFAMASRRNSSWRIRLSRSVTFQSVSLMAIGAYLVTMIVLATAIQLVGGTYARLAQITLIFAMSLIAMMVMPSGKFRAWLNVIIAKNFFQHRYDYRSEWMRFADTIGFPSQDTAPFHERVVKSLADIFDSPAGLLLTRDDESRLVLQARWNWATADVPTYAGNSHTIPFFESNGHILMMEDVREGTDERCDPRAVPQWLYDENRAWAVVPLVHFGRLAGIAVLARPPIKRIVDWEDLDMMRVVGRQLASYLAEATSQQALAESRQFEQFNRRFAFVMHDIKNLVSQLSILSRNAEKHANNPEWQADMVETLKSSVDKMNDLLKRLSQHSQTRNAQIEPVDVEKTILSVIHGKRLIYPIETDVSPGMMANADAGRIETILNHLIQNAIEATEDGSPVRISASRQGNEIAIRVSDNGCGMNENFVANQLFKPFESTKDGGFGIGAYEARALAQSLGGNLRVDSRLGKGTRMTLLLPATSADGAEARDAEGEIFPDTLRDPDTDIDKAA
jgi:putative PEP-CTERM system histidine kinase